MPDQPQGAQPAQPEQPPAWVRDYLAPALAQQHQRIEQIAHEVAQVAQRPAASAAPPKPPLQPQVGEVRERILTTIANEPERFVAELTGFAEQRAEAKINERVGQALQHVEQQRQAEHFWGGFYAANPDLQLFQSEVLAAFNSCPDQNPSARANYARDSVRQRIQYLQQQNDEAKKRETLGRRAMAGAPGVSFGAPDGAGEPVLSVDERTAMALDERRKYRAQRMGKELRNDPDYHEQMRQLKLGRQRMQGNRPAA